MNLIDRDALPVGTLHGWQYVSKQDLDAAPVISFERCKYEPGYKLFPQDVCARCLCASNFAPKDPTGEEVP